MDERPSIPKRWWRVTLVDAQEQFIGAVFVHAADPGDASAYAQRLCAVPVDRTINGPLTEYELAPVGLGYRERLLDAAALAEIGLEVGYY
jgi:hypothetical protein